MLEWRSAAQADSAARGGILAHYKSMWQAPALAVDAASTSAKVVAVQDQYGVVCFWALCNPEEKQTERSFHIFGTGHHIPNAGLKYLGTVQQMGGRLVWHVFEDIGHGATS